MIDDNEYLLLRTTITVGLGPRTALMGSWRRLRQECTSSANENLFGYLTSWQTYITHIYADAIGIAEKGLGGAHWTHRRWCLLPCPRTRDSLGGAHAFCDTLSGESCTKEG